MTRRYVDRARAVAASAEFVDVGRLGHYMLSPAVAVEPVRGRVQPRRARPRPREDPSDELPETTSAG